MRGSWLLGCRLALVAVVCAATAVAAASAFEDNTQSARLSKRIIGGVTAKRDEYPFAVYIRSNDIDQGGTSCAGAILTDKLVVTLASCVVDPKTNKVVDPSSIQFGYGDSSRTNQVQASVVDIVQHPDFNSSKATDDIAILQLEPLTFTSAINRIPVYTGVVKSKDRLVSMGWGSIKDIGKDEDNSDLMSTTLTVGFDSKCQRNDLYEGENGRVICTDNELSPGNSTCEGDIGGPLVKLVDGKWQLVGLFSRVATKKENFFKCTDADIVSYFTHVNTYMSFFTKTTSLSRDTFTANAPPVEDDGSGSGLSSGAKAGIGIGVAVAVIAIAGLSYMLYRSYKRAKGNRQESYIYELGLQQLADELGGSYEPKYSNGSSIFNGSSITPFSESFTRPSFATRYLRNSVHSDTDTPFSDFIPHLYETGTELNMDTLSKSHKYADGSAMVMEFIRPTRDAKVSDYYPLLQDFTLDDEDEFDSSNSSNHSGIA